jgi:hypothetical protein
MRLDWEVAKGKSEHSVSARKKAALLRMERIIRTVRFVADSVKDPKDQTAERERRILAMPISEFKEFAGMVVTKLSEMDHGVPSVYEDGKIFLLTPPHQCPNSHDAEEVTRLRVPFRSGDYIPGV